MFAEMKAIIEAVPEFEARCNIQRYGKVIEVMEGDGAGSIYESLSADDKRAHGLSPSFWAFDEYAQAPNSDLLDNLRTAMGKRSESLGIIISTQAANDMHPLSQLIDDAALGEDPSVYLQLACAPAEADIFDEKFGSVATRRSASFSIWASSERRPSRRNVYRVCARNFRTCA
jgi:hypothetical protein